MANAGAWDQGYAQGQGIGQQQRAIKERHKEIEWEDKHNDLVNEREAIRQRIDNLNPNSPTYAEDYAKGRWALTKSTRDYQDFLHPDKNPGVFEAVKHLIGLNSHPLTQIAPPRIGSSEQQPGVASATIPSGSYTATLPADAPKTVKGPVPATPTNTVIPNAKGLLSAGNLDIWNRPTVQNADGSHSSEYSTSFQDDQGHEVLVPTVVNGKFLTPDGKKPPEGSPEEKAMFKAAWDHYLKTGENLGTFDNPDNADAYAGALHNRGTKPSPQVLKAWAGQLKGQPAPVQQEATTKPQDTSVQVSEPSVTLGATPAYKGTPTVAERPLPGQYSTGTVKQLKERAAKLKEANEEVQRMLAGAPMTPEEEYRRSINAKIAQIDHSNLPDADKEEANRHLYGLTYKPELKPYTLPNGNIEYLDASRPDEIPPGATAYIKPDLLSQHMQDWENDPDPNKPDFTTWMANRSKKLTNVETERESYRASHNIPAGQALTYPQELDFVKNFALARNPFGGARIDMEREGLTFREGEAGLKDFLATQKQLTPLERIIQTSQETNALVSHPTGPGDVALTLAFFDAIKTTGVRFTKQEQDFIINSRGLLDSAKAKFDQGYQGTVFGPAGSPQRAIIAGIVKKAGDTAAQQKQTLTQGVSSFNPKVGAALGGGTPAADPARNDINKTSWPDAPSIGTVKKGHTYLGGDPSKPESWKVVGK